MKNAICFRLRVRAIPDGASVYDRPLHKNPEEFLELLCEHDIRILADVRSFPSSHRYPHFNRESLAETLQLHAIGYEWLGEQLGGYRKKGLGEDSPNKAWKSQGFRNYADYTMTEPFREGIRRLLEVAKNRRLAFMCAEQLYWRCHRRIISDYLKVKGHTVIHILGKGKTEEHGLTSFAKAVNGELRYP